jgi:hypothetical protein
MLVQYPRPRSVTTLSTRKRLLPPMNTAVRPVQAPPPSFRHATSERLISRVLFETPDGQIHQTSVYSTLALAHGSLDAEAALAVYRGVYDQLGYKILRMEFIDQIGLELGHE